MVSRFRIDLTQFLKQKYKKGQVVNDPYELVKEFCIDGVSMACAPDQKIPSVERKKEQLKKAKKEL